MRHVAWVALLLAAMVVLPVVVADDDWADEGRRLEVERSADGFEMRSDHLGDGQHDQIRLELDGPNVRYRFQFMEDVQDIEAEADLVLELERIVEFRDGNGDGAFQRAENVSAEYDQGDLTLAGIGVADVSSGGVPGVEVTATYAFKDFANATFGFRATAFANLTTFEGLQQSPVEIKLDLLFGDFPYTRDDTLPAIEMQVKSEAPSGPNVTAREVRFAARNLTAVFGWRSVATVDGVDRPVGVTVVREPDEIENGEIEAVLSVTFAYARGADIVHDPTFGFLRGLAEGVVGAVLGNLTFYLLGALMAVAVFGGLALTRRQKVKKT